MTQIFPDNHRHYITLTPDEALAPPDLPLNRVFRQTAGGELGMLVADGQRADAPRDMIVTLPFTESTERHDVRQRYGAMAQALKVRLIAIDNPGVGSGVLTKAMAAALAKGDFQAVNEAQWEALGQTNCNRPTELFGYSLGAPVAASLAAHAPDGVHFDRITLMESVGLAKRPFLPLARRAIKERHSWSYYKEENPAWMHGEIQPANMAIKAVAKSAAANRRYLQALRAKTLVDNLEKAADRGVIDDKTTIVVASGSQSRVSVRGYNDESVRELRQGRASMAGRVVVEQLVFVGESHGMIDSLPYFLAAVRAKRPV